MDFNVIKGESYWKLVNKDFMKLIICWMAPTAPMDEPSMESGVIKAI